MTEPVTPPIPPLRRVEDEPLDTTGVKPDHTRTRKPTAERLAKLGRNKSAKSPVRKIPPGELEKVLTKWYAAMGIAIMPFDMPCGQVFIKQAPKCAHSLDAWAQQNDTVRGALLWVLEAGVIGEVFAAHLPLLLAVMKHHSPMPIPDGIVELLMAENEEEAVAEAAEEFLRKQADEQ
jgi:hypothetical protein